MNPGDPLSVKMHGMCSWQLGGGNIPGTVGNFGRNPKAEYGPLLQLDYPTSPATLTRRYHDFRQILSGNPC